MSYFSISLPCNSNSYILFNAVIFSITNSLDLTFHILSLKSFKNILSFNNFSSKYNNICINILLLSTASFIVASTHGIILIQKPLAIFIAHQVVYASIESWSVIDT
ncbi:hypothetical protein HOG21_01955 [bacterium]|nr:hypothetical protein [bacterium]